MFEAVISVYERKFNVVNVEIHIIVYFLNKEVLK